MVMVTARATLVWELADRENYSTSTKTPREAAMVDLLEGLRNPVLVDGTTVDLRCEKETLALHPPVLSWDEVEKAEVVVPGVCPAQPPAPAPALDPLALQARVAELGSELKSLREEMERVIRAVTTMATTMADHLSQGENP